MTDTKLTAELLDELETYVKRQRLPGEMLPDVVYFKGGTALSLISAARASLESRASVGRTLGIVAAQTKVLDLHQECGDHYCEFHSGKEEEFAHECETCDSIDRLRAAKVELGELLGADASAAGAESMSGWVLASERKPNPDDTVLAWGPGWSRGGIASMYEDGSWLDVETAYRVTDVTHWMPLPSPPEPTNGR